MQPQPKQYNIMQPQPKQSAIEQQPVLSDAELDHIQSDALDTLPDL